MQPLIPQLSTLCGQPFVITASTILRIIALLVIGIPFISWISHRIGHALKNYLSLHHATVAKKSLYYTLFLILGMLVLHEAGFNISALIGAAGIVGIAVGFAAQTTVSNIISGLFLLVENALAIGDVIICGNIRGTVHSIHLIAVNIKTDENTMVRISYQDILKANLINLSHFPTCRLAFNIEVENRRSSQEIADFIKQSIEKHADLFAQKQITIIAVGIKDVFGKQYVQHTVYVWVTTSNINIITNKIVQSLQAEAQKENLVILVNRI